MTADYASNLNMMMALNNFTGGAYKYQFPTITTNSNTVSMDMSGGSVFGSEKVPSAMYHAIAMANAANMGNYIQGFNTDRLNASLSTPAWMQNMNNNLNANIQLLNQPLMNPFASAATNSGVTNPYISNPYTVNPNPVIEPHSVKNLELAQELNKYGISSTGDEVKDKKALAKAKEKEKSNLQEAQKIVDEISDAVRSMWGTDNDKLKAAVKKINKNNIMAVMEAWKSYSPDKSLIQTIQGEFHWYDGGYGLQHELEEHLQKALSASAEEKGLVSEAGNFRRKVKGELDSSMYSSDSNIREAFEDMFNKVSSKDAELKEEKKQKAAQNNK